jgi:vacuolar protein sorting-associated protein 13A/C
MSYRSLAMSLAQTSGDSSLLLSSSHDGSVPAGNLLTLAYARVQQHHPDFMTKHEGFDQDIKVSLSTFIFHAAPEPVISLYDFIMTTFVPEKSTSPPPPVSAREQEGAQGGTQGDPSRSGKIRVAVDLASVQSKCIFTGMTASTMICNLCA